MINDFVNNLLEWQQILGEKLRDNGGIMAMQWTLLLKQSVLLTGIVSPFLLQSAYADSLNEQRNRYQQVKTAWDNKQMDEVNRLMPTLKTYPLYPYLEYRQMTQNLTSLTSKQVTYFIETHPTLPLNANLSRNFASELARRQDWKGLLSFVKEEPKAVAARCQYHYAQWATGNKHAAFTGVNEIWLHGKSLPKECDSLFNVWREAGHQTVDITLERILLAAQAGKDGQGIVSYLTKQLPESKKTLAEDVVKLQATPTNLVDFSKKYSASTYTREVVLKTFPLFSRQNTAAAKNAIPALVKNQKMTAEQQLVLEKNVAGRFMNRSASGSDAKWRDNIVKKSGDTPLVERRIRLALGNGDYKDLANWLPVLSAEAKKKDEWRYWQAVLLLEKNKKSEANSILKALSKERGFYPMVAAQKLNQPYNVYVVKANHEKKANSAILKRPEIARVKELLYWQLEGQARSEWVRLVASQNAPEQELLARYAFDNDWADLSVQATITGKLWNHLEERFPVAYPSFFKEALKDKSISMPFALAIARQESAWNPQAQSPVGARGLMQLMPYTANDVAKKMGMTTYKSVNQLLDPRTNIQMGTYYLDSVYTSFGNNRILAAAAYNAGPHRVTTWLNNSAGRLDAVAFVESIPFTETRGYVKNVLSYDVFYHHFMKQKGTVLTQSELQRKY